LSSNGGRDFGAFLGGLEQLGYGWAYRVLDAQWVRTQRHPRAVPQRRRRVFVVGCLGDPASAAAVLFERESVQRNPAKGAKARQSPAADARSGAEGGGGRLPETVGAICADHGNVYSGQDAYSGRIIAEGGRKWPADVTCTLNTMYATKLGLEDQHALHGAPAFVLGEKPSVIWREGDQANAAHCIDFAGTLNCDKGQQGGIIAQPIVIDRAAFNAGENALYTAQIGASDTKPSLVARGPHAFQLAGDRSNPTVSVSDIAFCLPANPMSDRAQAVATQQAVATYPINGMTLNKELSDKQMTGIGEADDPMFTIRANGTQHAVATQQAIAFKPGQSADARSLGESEEVACTLEAGGGGNNRQAVALAQQPVREVAATIGQRMRGLDDSCADNLLLAQQPVPFDLFQITAPLNRQSRSPGDPCHTLAVSNAAFAAIVIPETHTIAFTQNQREEVRLLDNVAGAIAAEPGTHQSTYLLQPTAQPIAFHPTQDPISSVGVSHALGTGSTEGAASCAVAFEPRYYTRDNKTGGKPSDVSVLKADASKAGDSSPHVATSLAVRRLTPRECERLQGFPDDYTAITYRGKPAADGPRYKAMGNSMAVNCMAWIGERIAAVNARIEAALEIQP
jgi:site-specific DNA-cytosine methylase